MLSGVTLFDLELFVLSTSKKEIIVTFYLAPYSGHFHSIELAKGFGLCIFSLFPCTAFVLVTLVSDDICEV